MAQQQQNITIAAPGFRGLNTQDSPITQIPEYAATADNCIIDQYGRIGARKGFNTLTTSNTPLGGEAIQKIHEFIADDSTTTVLSTGNSLIFSGTTTLTDETPGSYTVSGDDWDFATLDDHCYLCQRGHEPLVYQASTSTLIKISDHASYSGSAPQGNICLSAYGRLWVADITGDKHTIYWSDLLAGYAWTGGSSGSIDIAEYWPDGADEIVDLAAHNGFLIVFGKRSILIYTGADNAPASNLALEDTISGIGAAARDTVFSVGTDLWFLDVTGVRSLGRTVQEKSVPLGDVSRNVREEIKGFISDEATKITCQYHPEEGFYLVGFEDALKYYCFDAREILDTGAAKTTTWTVTSITAAHRQQDGTLLLGGTPGVGSYYNYDDDGEDYLMRYYTHELTFGQPSMIKFPKQIDLTIIGGAGTQPALKWGYDYTGVYKSKTFTLVNADIGEYGTAEYEAAEYSESIVVVRPKTNVTGSGNAITLGFEVTVGSALSIQEINIQALLGRIT